MALEPEIAAYVRDLEAFHLAAGPMPTDPPGRRARLRALCKQFEPPVPPGIAVTDKVIGSVPVRLYRKPGAERPPVVVFFHGGGWVIGDLDTHASIPAGIAEATGALVVSVHYRLAPEHRYPAAFDDAWTVVTALAAEGASAIVVSGDSAGGNLAAAVALAARDRGGPKLAGQALIYPCVDPALDRPSCESNANGPVLTRAAMADFWSDYLGGQKPDAYAAPILASDLGGLAPALVTIAGHDPLRDEGHDYAQRLGAAGVPVKLSEAPGLVHGYLRARLRSPAAASEFATLCAWIGAALELK